MLGWRDASGVGEGGSGGGERWPCKPDTPTSDPSEPIFKLGAIVQVPVIPTRRQEADPGASPEAAGQVVWHTLAKRPGLKRGRKARIDTQRLSSDLHVLADDTEICRGTEGWPTKLLLTIMTQGEV